MIHTKPWVHRAAYHWEVHYNSPHGRAIAIRLHWREAMDFALAVAASCPWNPRGAWMPSDEDRAQAADGSDW